MNQMKVDMTSSQVKLKIYLDFHSLPESKEEYYTFVVGF